MKIYRVIYSSICLDEGDTTINVTTFLNKELAEHYLQERIKDLKMQQEDLDGYCVEEDEHYYERYLEGRAIEDTVAIWLEDADTYDEIEKQSIKDEKENDYDI